ncbi:MAG TPA: hypothetical protein ENG22_04705 [Candidatus Bathyarchaeota archaeon]|nr:hypothetical protein [Candidatus Bathyarchaeota archaeon]
MKFTLELDILFNKELPAEAHEKISEWLKEAGETILLKGCPKNAIEEACRITEYKILNDRLHLKLESGRRVRAHVGLMRLWKFLAPRIGKEFKVGLKDVKVKKFLIEVELDRKPLKPVTLPFTEYVKFENGKAYLSLKDIDMTAFKKNYIDKLLTRLKEKIAAQYVTGKAALSRVVRESPPRLEKYKLRDDPTPLLLEKKWIKEYPLAGVWLILPPFTALIRAIESLVIDRIAKPMNFKEVLFPRLIPLEVEYRKGHIAIANEIWWVCRPKSRDPAFFEDVVDYAIITGTVPREKLMEKLEPPSCGLSYAQCEPFYQIFFKEVVDLDEEPIKFFDRFGPTWRYEAGGLKGIERLTEFYRIEFAWLSSPEKVIEIRDEILKRAEKILDKIFDVEYYVEATTPVYLEHAGMVEEKESKMEYVKTYDLVVKLPFQTKSRPEKILEIASFNVHEDFYAKRFYFKEKRNRPVWTGCVGIGPSRWAYIFIVRWGLDFDEWPKEIRKYIGEKLPKSPKLVTW